MLSDMTHVISKTVFTYFVTCYAQDIWWTPDHVYLESITDMTCETPDSCHSINGGGN